MWEWRTYAAGNAVVAEVLALQVKVLIAALVALFLLVGVSGSLILGQQA